jgi:predicted dienelactone hydrolase
VAQNTVSAGSSFFNGKLNTNKIGLAGHSQGGGGVAILTSNNTALTNIAGVVSFNPFFIQF